MIIELYLTTWHDPFKICTNLADGIWSLFVGNCDCRLTRFKRPRHQNDISRFSTSSYGESSESQERIGIGIRIRIECWE